MVELATTDLALKILSRYKLCNKCLGKLYYDPGYVKDEERGESVKIVLYIEAFKYIQEDNYNHGIEILKTLAENGDFHPAYLSLKELNINMERGEFQCDSCTGKIDLNSLKDKNE
ncbi:MAG: hypothetical protein QXY40_07700 [Candidatus Methanomethylicia archaeon]